MTRRLPVIGLTTYGVNSQGELTLPVAYVTAVQRAGGMPLLIPPGETDLQMLLTCVDAIVLSGGGDLDPACYHQTRHPTIYLVDPQRDQLEMTLARAIVEQQVPTLAICRGMQVVNVALGGTLHQHLPDVLGEQVRHRAPPRLPTPHRVQVDEGSRLAAILQQTDCRCMSWHHQAICDIASQLQVVARAADGVIEAIEMPDHRWLVGVQWHPELTAAQDTAQQRLFDELVRAARHRPARPTPTT